MRTMTRSMICAAVFIVTSFGALNAQEAPSQFVPFQDFIQATQVASYGEYATRQGAGCRTPPPSRKCASTSLPYIKALT